MRRKNLPRLLIGATGSGCGKTTFTCGLLQALCNRKKKPAAFKCGPDYIDPMFHTEVLGVPSRNLDLFFSDLNTINRLLAKPAGDLAIIEGVMGYYDGLAGSSTDASAYDLAAKTGTPAVLLVDARGKSVSVAAEIKGFLDFKPDNQIKGVLLNRVSDMLYPRLKKLIEDSLDIKVYGYIPQMKDCSLESRHLGLVTAKEIKNLRELVGRIAAQIEDTVEIDGLLQLAEESLPVSYTPLQLASISQKPVRIGVAMDRAFCFYYEDNLDLLRGLGAEIVPFSPISDPALPEALDGLIFGGGYPELYVEQLSSNRSMCEQVKEVIENGMACLAECGGFMYLHRFMKTEEGKEYPMAGVIEGTCYPTGKLSRFGYMDLKANTKTLLGENGTVLKGHEFHYWDSTNNGNAFCAQKPMSERSWQCMIAKGRFLAGYPHIYFSKDAAISFMKACLESKGGPL